MLNSELFDDLVKNLFDAIPIEFRELDLDLKKNFQGVLQGTFEKFDLVTREEFDIQAKVLAKTRAKVDALEKEISKLEREKQKTK